MKFLLFIFLLFLCLNKVSGQIEVGLKGGYNLARIPYPTSPPDFTQSHLSAFNAGVIAIFRLRSHLSLQYEIVYSAQGSREIAHATYGDQVITSRYNYLNIPGLLVYHHRSGFFIETGLQLGIFLTGKTDYSSFQIKADDIQAIDIAWIIGLGYRIPGINLGIDTRYNLGFTAVNKSENPGESSWYNRVFQLGLFYVFKKL